LFNKIKLLASKWEFSHYERKALQFLIVLILIGSGIKIHQRYKLNQQLLLLSSETKIANTISDSMFYQQPTVDNPLDLNKAVQYQLEMLKGIGPVRAGRIIEYRQQHGQFERIEDLTQVYGIGQKTVDSIRELIVVKVENQSP
jgi:competence ComEA-like helix-hairpin-helix protein